MTQNKQFLRRLRILTTQKLKLPMNSSTHDEFHTFLPPSFQPITLTPVGISLSSSPHTDATPIIPPLSSNAPDVPSPITDDQLEHDLDGFFTHQHQIHNTNNWITIHQLTHSASNSKSSIPFCPNCPLACTQNFDSMKKPEHHKTIPQKQPFISSTFFPSCTTY